LPINVRIANASDFEVLARLYNDFYVELRGKQGWRAEDVEAIRSSVKQYIEDASNVIFIGFMDVDPVGFVRVSVREGCFWAEEIYVKPNYRLAGVGRSLMSHVEEYVVRRGGDAIYAMVSPQNKTALLFLRSLGYNILNTIELVKLPKPIPEEDVRWMELLGLKFKTWKWTKEEYSEREREYLEVVEEFFKRGGAESEFLQIVTRAIKDYMKKPC
jgi:ribosomal protein S18 acetylase RimI-like enzyme